MKLSANAQVAIVVPARATKREEFAAQELSKYLNKIFPGIRVEITGDANTSNAIFVGGPERNRAVAAYISKADFDTRVPGPEGIFIKAYGADTLVLAGSSKNVNERERGTLYAVYERLLLQWKDAGAQVGYYDYCISVHGGRQRYMPCADEMQSFWTRYKEVGIQGSGTQMEYFNFWNHIFNFYCFVRMGYDISLSMEDNLQKFTRIFGEGAPYMAEAIRIAEDSLDGQITLDQGDLYFMDNLGQEKKGQIYDLFDKAFSAASTAAARNNIRMFRMGFRYSDLECAETEVRYEFIKYRLLEQCNDPTGELYYMSTHFDTRCWHSDLGYGIQFPLDYTESDYQPDHWYLFEV